MTRLQLNALECRLLNAESGKGAYEWTRHCGDTHVCLTVREFRELLTYVEDLERQARDPRLDDAQIERLADRIADRVADAVGSVHFRARDAVKGELEGHLRRPQEFCGEDRIMNDQEYCEIIAKLLVRQCQTGFPEIELSEGTALDPTTGEQTPVLLLFARGGSATALGKRVRELLDDACRLVRQGQMTEEVRYPEIRS